MSRSEVLRCYRAVLRTGSTVFAGDQEALHISKNYARQEFEKNRNLTDPDLIKKAIQLGYDSMELLKKSIIQGKLNEKGNYELDIKDHHIFS